MTSHQPSLFSVTELSGNYQVPIQPLQMSAKTLHDWKQQVYVFQQQVTIAAPPQQGTLFDLPPTAEDIADQLNPFSLPQQNTEFWRWQADGEGVPALYFVIDYELPILLYVGETVKSNLRWKGEHDCKRYLLNYISAHRPDGLPVAVNIGFWSNAPTQTRDRQQIELALIHKWKPPFNKENWVFWGTPFTGGK